MSLDIEFENVIEAELDAETSMSIPQRFEQHLNNKENPHEVTKEQLGLTKLSVLENDTGYLTEEKDPTVPAWAKASQKPSYTPEEVGSEPANTTIVKDAVYVHTDNNYISDDKQKVDKLQTTESGLNILEILLIQNKKAATEEYVNNLVGSLNDILEETLNGG